MKPFTLKIRPQSPEITSAKVGPVTVLWFKTPKAQAWRDENLNYERWQARGVAGVAIENRYVSAIVAEAENAGFKVGV